MMPHRPSRSLSKLDDAVQVAPRRTARRSGLFECLERAVNLGDPEAMLHLSFGRAGVPGPQPGRQALRA